MSVCLYVCMSVCMCVYPSAEDNQSPSLLESAWLMACAADFEETQDLAKLRHGGPRKWNQSTNQPTNQPINQSINQTRRSAIRRSQPCPWLASRKLWSNRARGFETPSAGLPKLSSRGPLAGIGAVRRSLRAQTLSHHSKRFASSGDDSPSHNQSINQSLCRYIYLNLGLARNVALSQSVIQSAEELGPEGGGEEPEVELEFLETIITGQLSVCLQVSKFPS